MQIQCYAQRLLNPFRGIVNVIKYEAAEAVTTDGVRWDIYVSNDELKKDLNSTGRVLISDIRYGSWSADQGLRRGPIFPSDDFIRMEKMGDVVFNHLLKVHNRIPFALKDHYELWMLSEDTAPLVLLDSAINRQELDFDIPAYWRSGNLCHEKFASDAVAEILHEKTDTHCAATILMQHINELAGQNPSASWFHRLENGDGVALQQSAVDMPASLFPPLMIRGRGYPEPYQQLVDDFICWQAPWLLVLDSLQDTQRRQFEHDARRQALQVEQQYRSYPKIIDPEIINAARIEARMRHTLEPDAQVDDTMSTFYLELHNPSPTE